MTSFGVRARPVATFPQQFGKFILLRKIAKGGMAEIFLAKAVGAEGFEKDLVVKRILPHYSEDEDFVTMFIDEATIAAKLQHANIVQIFDFNVHEGAYYIAMEYVEGKDLKDCVEHGIRSGNPMPPSLCVWVITEVAKGLHYAHTKSYKGKPLNIVHRDVSPQNALVSFNGEVKVMDFGIAKAANRSTKTIAGTVKGKCAYMSPEQAKGKPLDGRSDLFALGVMLWEMLTHKRLFVGDSDFLTLTNVLKQEAPPPSSINPEVAPELDDIVLKALSKDRDLRYKDCQDFERALTKWFYSSVDDLDAANLSLWMRKAFSQEIAQRQQQAREEKTMFLVATGTEDDHAAASGMPAPAPDEATVALPSMMDADPTEATTMLEGDLDADKVRAAIAAAQAAPVGNDAATRAITAYPGASTDTFATAGAPPPRSRGKVIAIAALVTLLLGGGGVAGWYFTLGPGGKKASGQTGQVVADNGDPGKATGGDDANNKKKKPAEAVLTLVVSPEDAKPTFIVDEENLTGNKVRDIFVGDQVAVKVTAEGYQTAMQVIDIDKPKQKVTIKLTKKGKPEDKRITVVIQPSDKTARVSVDGKDLGTGPQKIVGPAGSKHVVTVSPAGGGAPMTKTVTLSDAEPLVSFKTSNAVAKLAQLAVKCQAGEDAKVTANVGKVEPTDGGWMIRGIVVGQAVKVTCEAKGFESKTQNVIAEKAQNEVALELDKTDAPKAQVSGYGSLVVNANPWAQCKVSGHPWKMTKYTIPKLKAGGVTVTCKLGDIVKKKRVKIVPNRQRTVVVKMK